MKVIGALVALACCTILTARAIEIQTLQNVPLENRAVVENSLREAQLPSDLTNRFYKDPRIAAALAKESWFTSKEMPVLHREAENIPRSQVLKIFQNAGWLRRR